MAEYKGSIALTSLYDGQSADVWTIGEDGYWYKNGIKTDQKATGKDGISSFLYEAEWSYYKINKLFEKDLILSPLSLGFRLLKSNNIQPVESYSYSLKIVNESAYQDIVERSKTIPLILLDEEGNEVTTTLYAELIQIHDNKITLNLNPIYNNFLSSSISSTDKTWYEGLRSLLIGEEPIFLCWETFDENKQCTTRSIIPVDYGTTEDLAKFNLNATNITAAINNSKLVFDGENGLTVQNGGLRILDLNAQPLLSFNKDGGLYIKGNGEFTGTIYAVDGSFEGSINAKEGSIGGFSILEDRLISKATLGDEPSISLNGTTGEVIANNILLGDKATIKNSIELGDAKLWNPLSSPDSNTLLEMPNLLIRQDGRIVLGDLIFDGLSSSIYGNTFTIKPNHAFFENVTISGKIESAIFETNSTQVVGGSMLFKPAYKILSTKTANGNLEIELDTISMEELEIGKYILLLSNKGSQVGSPTPILSINNNSVVVAGTYANLDELQTLISVGYEKDLVMAVNSGGATALGTGSRSFSIGEFNSLTGKTETKVFLGDLAYLQTSSTSNLQPSGYGLYSENAYLRGTLTTEVNEENSYAGINTISPINSIHFDDEKIVFWAGAYNTTTDSIQKSPFQVTEEGSIYASKAILTNSLISQSEIRGVDIYAANIYGTGTEIDQFRPGLSFFNTNNGIAFFREDNTEQFRIGLNAFSMGDFDFVEFLNNQVKLKSHIGEISKLLIPSNSNKTTLILEEETIGNENLKFEISEKIKVKEGLEEAGEWSLEKFHSKSATSQLDKTILFDDRMKYEKIEDKGYNLYVW